MGLFGAFCLGIQRKVDARVSRTADLAEKLAAIRGRRQFGRPRIRAGRLPFAWILALCKRNVSRCSRVEDVRTRRK